jgi:sigma-E factor negative regulatory protein RseA
MSEDIKEQLSALMDGELSRDERAFLLRRLDHDAELRALWARMHLARDVIMHRPGGAPVDLADRVMSALAEEIRAPQIQQRTVNGARWRPWLGAAIAASVALVAVLSIGPRGLEQPAMLAEAPAPRMALPAGVPGPIAPSLSGVGNGVQTVAAERSTVIGGPNAISADQLLLLRHGQVSDGSWQVGGAAHVYDVDSRSIVGPIETASGQ